MDEPTPQVWQHENPAWRARADSVLRVDLAPYGMPGRFEQLWTRRRAGAGLHELCCIPFFTYAVSLGDVFRVRTTGQVSVIEAVVVPSGRANVRLAFRSRQVAAERHQEVHAAVAASGLPHEWRSAGYLAVSVNGQAELNAIWSVLSRWADTGDAALELDRPGEARTDA